MMTRILTAFWLTLSVALLAGCGERAAPVVSDEPPAAPAAMEAARVAGEAFALPTAEQQFAASQLLGLYSQFGDEADRAGFRRLFTADAHVEIGGETRSPEAHVEGQIARYTGLRQAGFQPRRLFASPVLAAVAPQELRVRGVFSDLLARPAGGGEPLIMAVGRFQATLLRGRDGDWRIHDWREWPDEALEVIVPAVVLPEPEAIEPEEVAIDGRAWRLVELDGESLPPRLPAPTLALEAVAARASGFAGVGNFEGRIRLGAETLRFTAVIARGAEEPEEAAALQAAYLEMLGRVRAWQLDERAARLVLLDESAEPLAAFVAAD